MANVYLPVSTATDIGNPIESGWGVAMRLAVEAAAPAACIKMYAGETAPDGWLTMVGQSVVNFQSLYPVAWTRVPTSWKSGNTVTFPDTRARVAVGSAGFGDMIIGSTGGLNEAPLTIGNMPSHNHGGMTGADDRDHVHSWGGTFITTGQTRSHSHGGQWGATVQGGGGGTAMMNPGGAYGPYNEGTLADASADHEHYVTLFGYTSGYSTPHLHPITLQGSGVPVSRMQAHFAVTFIMRVY